MNIATDLLSIPECKRLILEACKGFTETQLRLA